METLASETPRNGRFRIVTVVSTSGSTCTVSLPGVTTSAGQLTGVRRLKNYIPTVGEQALLWSDGAFQVLVGAVA